MAKHRGANCTCSGFDPNIAAQIDVAAGRAREFLASTRSKLDAVDPCLPVLGLSDDRNPTAVAAKAISLALRHHFHFDPIQRAGLAVPTVFYDSIKRVYDKMSTELATGITYVLGTEIWNPLGVWGRCWSWAYGAAAYTVSIGPREIHLNPAFLQLPSSGGGWAWALFHEQVHYASRHAPAGLNDIGDKAYFELELPKYMRLRPAEAVRNADSYTWFARELVDPQFIWDSMAPEYPDTDHWPGWYAAAG